MALKDFYTGTTWKFSGNVKVNGVLQDITPDRVYIVLKGKATDTDEAAALIADANVIDSGAEGVYYFDIKPAITAIEPGKYFAEIVWRPDGGVDDFILEKSSVQTLGRISDPL